MNAPAQVSPIESGKIAANEAVIRGRVGDVKRTEKAVYTDVVIPAADSYSSPATVRLVSSRLIGKPGEDVAVRVQIKGYRRKYEDQKTGETGFAVDNKLSVIEA